MSDIITIIGNNNNNNLVGTVEDNLIQGLAGNDTLSGLGGIDTLEGGDDNDTYTINDADVVDESASNGIDLVRATISYSLTTNVENLTLSGSGVINGTGNELDNTIIGNNSSNTLIGGDGNDLVDGKGGDDSLEGGNGDDIYVVDSLSDAVNEIGTGTDLVQSSVSFSLGSNLENLTLTGSTDINGTGNSVDNVILGNGKNNQLTGLEGNDTLTGGSGNDLLSANLGNDSLVGGLGADQFLFNSAVSPSNLDVIKDFSKSQGDKIVFEDNVFTKLKDDFSFARVADPLTVETQGALIVYNRSTGELFYNPNEEAAGLGTGGGLIAVLENNFKLGAFDFNVI